MHASTTLTLRSMLLAAPFSWWVVGSLVGFGLMIVFWTLDRATRVTAWVYRNVHAAATRQAPTPHRIRLLLTRPHPPADSFLSRRLWQYALRRLWLQAMAFSTGGST